jgi:hypothetical protein
MSRITPSTATASETAWQPDTWYRGRLEAYEISLKGTPGWQGKPRKHNRVELQWAIAGTDDLVFDWVDLTVSPRKDGTHAKCKVLICALAGRDPRVETGPWIDADTMEFGFGALPGIDPNTLPIIGRIVQGIEIALKGEVTTKDGVDRLDVQRYGAPHMANPVSPQQVAGPSAVVSADGRYLWNGTQWLPVVTPPPPTPAPAAAPVQTDLL